MRSWGVAIAAAVVVIVPRAAFGQDSTAAQALFDEARQLMAAGKYNEACPKLAASQKLDPGAGTLMNLAGCYEKNGQIASAWATYKEAASSAHQSGHPDWETGARNRASALEPTLSRVTIVVPPEADVAGLVIERDGRAVDRAEWGVAIPVDAGTHAVHALAPKKQQWSTTVTVGPNGARGSVTVPALAVEQSDGANAPIATTGTAPPASDRGAAPEASNGSTQRTLGIVAAGAGVVGLVIGGIFGLNAKSTHDDALENCAGNRCSQKGIDLGQQADDKAAVSTVAFIAGGVLLAGGAALYFTAPKSSSSAKAGLWMTGSASGAAMGVGGAF